MFPVISKLDHNWQYNQGFSCNNICYVRTFAFSALQILKIYMQFLSSDCSSPRLSFDPEPPRINPPPLICRRANNCWARHPCLWWARGWSNTARLGPVCGESLTCEGAARRSTLFIAFFAADCYTPGLRSCSSVLWVYLSPPSIFGVSVWAPRFIFLP